MLRVALVPALVLLAGCNCNAAQDYVFPTLSLPDALEPPTNFGSWLSLDVAPDGARITMAYYDQDRTGLGYAVGTPSGDGSITWAHERVDGYPDSTGLDLGDVGKYASQRTMPDGTVWVAYQDVRNETLKVSQRLGPQNWSEPVIVESGGAWIDLQVDADGQPVVVHCDGASVRLVRYDGAAWNGTTLFAGQAVDPRPASVAYTKLLVDGNDEIVAFYDEAAQSLNLLEGSGTSFTHSVADDAGNVGAWPSLRKVGPNLVVAYQDVGNQDLKVATRVGNSWDVEVVDDGELRGADTELLEIDGDLAVVYFDGFENDVRLARRQGGSWDRQVLGAAGVAVGFHNEVVYAGGEWWAGSYDYTNGTLFVTRP